ncbi:MAG: hypothetical protein ACJAUK_002432 [Colwellia polaris]
MSKAAAQANIRKFEQWMNGMISSGWLGFTQLEYQGCLNRTKVSKASGVDLNALKKDKGNPAILELYSELEKKLQKALPDVFEVRISALQQYHLFVEKLESGGGRFPVDAAGDVDVIKLSKDIGFPVARLNSPSIKKQLDSDLKRVGTEVVQGKSIEERMEEGLVSTSSELSKCRKDLAIAEEKIEVLTKLNLKLESDIRKLEKKSSEKDESLIHAIGTGRRWAL